MSAKNKKNNVLVGVCGGIAAYKTCELVRLFVKNGYSVKVMMTESAGRFVTPLTFQTLSQNPVYSDMFSLASREAVEHVSLGQWADLCVIAPCSANSLTKIAVGICDNFLTTAVCALNSQTAVLMAPAMNDCMWHNPIIQAQAATLKKLKKYILMPPLEGELACQVYGQGRMPEAKDIYKKALTLI